MQPRRNLVLIVADKQEEKTKSGLYIGNESWKTLPPTGTIEAVGPDVQDKKLKKGVRVLFNRYAAVVLNDQDRLITEGDVLAIVDKSYGKTN